MTVSSTSFTGEQSNIPSVPAWLPGFFVAAGGVIVALIAHHFVGQVGALTWAVLLGAVVANLGLLPERSKPGLKLVTKKMLRVGVVLLGFSLSLVSIIALGAPVIALVVVTLFTTLIATTWLGMRMNLGRARSLLIGTGFAICGASAIAAMEENAEADDDDVAVAIAMVTICGTVAMIALPFLQGPLGLTDLQFGAWAGASVHQVGQVDAAASPAGAAAVSVAVVVKLTRVLLLTPVVAAVSVDRRRRLRCENSGATDSKLPPFVPVFVLSFLACVLIRSTGMVPASLLTVISSSTPRRSPSALRSSVWVPACTCGLWYAAVEAPSRSPRSRPWSWREFRSAASTCSSEPAANSLRPTGGCPPRLRSGWRLQGR